MTEVEGGDLACTQPHPCQEHENGPVAATSFGVVAARHQSRHLLRPQTLGELGASPARDSRCRGLQLAGGALLVQEAEQRAQALNSIFGGAYPAVPAFLRDEPGHYRSVQPLEQNSTSHHFVEEKPGDVLVLDYGGCRGAAFDDEMLEVALDEFLDRSTTVGSVGSGIWRVRVAVDAAGHQPPRLLAGQRDQPPAIIPRSGHLRSRPGGDLGIIVDSGYRLMHHLTTVNIRGSSCRLDDKKRAGVLSTPAPLKGA